MNQVEFIWVLFFGFWKVFYRKKSLPKCRNYFDIHFLHRYFRYLSYIDNINIDIITPLLTSQLIFLGLFDISKNLNFIINIFEFLKEFLYFPVHCTYNLSVILLILKQMTNSASLRKSLSSCRRPCLLVNSLIVPCMYNNCVKISRS